MGLCSALSCCFGNSSDDSDPIEFVAVAPVTVLEPLANGLQLLTGESPEGMGIDFIAVHGIGGHLQNTWTDSVSKYYWLKDLAGQLEMTSTARVFTFGYEAGSISQGSQSSVATVYEIAMSLLNGLRRERYGQQVSNPHPILTIRVTAYSIFHLQFIGRPIVFICHSLGGIVVKRALGISGPNPTFKDIRDSVSGVIFMATPHQGSETANTALTLSKILEITPFGTGFPTQLVEDMKTNCDTLMDLSEGFRHQTIQIISFYETKPTLVFHTSMILVPRHSAVLNVSGEIILPCEDDHHTICKFASVTDHRFQAVVREIKMMVASVTTQEQLSRLSDRDQVFLRDLGSRHTFDPLKQLQDVLAQKCGSTAQWIHEHETFQKWKDSPSNEVLWLTGGPGSGKTVMAGSIIDQLQKECDAGNSVLLYYFVDGKEAEKSNPLNVFPGLIYQLLRARPTLVDMVRRSTGTDAYFSSTMEKSAKILHTIIKDIPKIFLFVDAIDECQVSRSELLLQLFDLQKDAKCLKLFVTSRTDPNCTIEGLFDQYSTPRICLTIDNTNADIAVYLAVEMRKFHMLRSDNDRHGTEERKIKQKIVDTILKDAAGMFLYASMAWSTFRDDTDRWDTGGLERRFRCLEALAGGGTATNEAVSLPSFYLGILKMLPSVKGAEARTKKLFQWLVAAHKTLTLAELRDAFSLEFDDTSRAGMGDTSLEAFKTVLRQSCGAFIIITNATQTVGLYHQSIREFFMTTAPQLYRFTRVEAEIHCSTACLTYLSFTDLTKARPGPRSARQMRKDDAQLVTDFPLLEYATLQWPHHVAQVSGDVHLWNLFVSWANSDNLALWCRIYWEINGIGDCPSDATQLHVVSYLGLEYFVKIALSGDGLLSNMVNTCDSLNRTPLHWAAINGHSGIVSILVDSGAKTAAMDSSGLTPLELALERGNSDAVLLLMKGCELQDHWLEMAVIGGHPAAVQLLLDRGAGVNSLSLTTKYGSALHAAAYRGNEQIVGVLLDASADVLFFSDTYGTALEVAVFRGHLGVVKLLIDKGADVNGKAGRSGTALQAAAQRGFPEIVKLLIGRGAHVDTPPQETLGTALYLAKSNGHRSIVDILERAGALCEGPQLNRRESVVDPIVEYRIRLTEHGIHRGDQLVVRGQLKLFEEAMRYAVVSQSERTVALELAFAIPYFRASLRLASETFMMSLIDVGFTVARDAVKAQNPRVLSMIIVTWTNAILIAMNEGKSSFVERALLGCIAKLKTCIDEHRIEDAKNLITVGVEILIQACRVGHQELIELLAKVWAGGVNDAIKGPFRESVFDIAEIYGEIWVKAAVRKDQVEVRVLGNLAVEMLLAAAGNAIELSTQLTAWMLVKLRLVLSPTNLGLMNWLLHEGESISAVTLGSNDNVQAEVLVTVAMQFFLALKHRSPGSNDERLEKVLLGISTTVLRGIERAGHLESAKDAIERLANQHFDLFCTRYRRKEELVELENHFLDILDLISEDGSEIPSLQATVKSLQDAIAAYAKEARYDLD